MKPALALLFALPLSPAVAQVAPTPSAPAATPTGPVTYGAGHKLCSDWIAAETKPDGDKEYMANRFWVAGFMSAYNWYVSTDGFDIGRGLTPDLMKSSMHSECAAHPTETIATAASNMLTMLKGRQGK